MNITILHDGVKRTINGDFDICMSREDMERLKFELMHKLSDKSWSFGWHSIRRPLPNSVGHPRPWKED